jgi:cyclohexadieny/prephenate dehydrogenase
VRVAVLGLGLIGASVARAYRNGDPDAVLIGFDADPDARLYVQAQGWVKVVDSAKEAVQGADLIVLATPVPAYASLLHGLEGFAEGCVLVDVGSMKVAAVEAMKASCPSSLACVPSHPIAGLERHGPRNSNPELFKNHWCVLTPITSDQKAIEKATTFWETVGMRVTRLSPETHDKVLGFTSHLPHLISFGMAGAGVAMERSEGEELLKLSAGSFRDFTRIARSNPELWTDILMANVGHLAEAYELLKSEVEPVLAALQARDRETACRLITAQHTDFKERVDPELR